jgi:transcriptional regulator with XRE-family HTH domain
METTFNQRITELFEEYAIKRNLLAEKVGVKPQAITKWENGSAYPDETHLEKLLDFFNNIEEQWLRKGKGRKYKVDMAAEAGGVYQVRCKQCEERQRVIDQLLWVIEEKDRKLQDYEGGKGCGERERRNAS